MELKKIITSLESAFERQEVKEAVLDELWYKMNVANGIHSTGFCFAASEVIYRLNGGKKRWTVMRILDSKDWGNGTHYFLRQKESKEILDVTSSQYKNRGIAIPYRLGKGTGLRIVSNKAKSLARMAGLGEL